MKPLTSVLGANVQLSHLVARTPAFTFDGSSLTVASQPGAERGWFALRQVLAAYGSPRPGGCCRSWWQQARRESRPPEERREESRKLDMRARHHVIHELTRSKKGSGCRAAKELRISCDRTILASGGGWTSGAEPQVGRAAPLVDQAGDRARWLPLEGHCSHADAALPTANFHGTEVRSIAGR